MRRDLILLTGFDAFGGEPLNPSWQVAQALDGWSWRDHRVRALQLPTVFGRSRAVLDEALRDRRLALVLCLGQAAGRGELSLERVAINVDDARIADNAGAVPVDQVIVPGGPAACFSTLPIKAMAAAVQAAGIPAGISQTAGTFVCNHVFYALQHRLRRRAVRSGFMHLPLLPEQGDRFPGLPVMPLAQQIEGTRVALAAAVDQGGRQDLRLGGGALS
ncbi:MAG: pyroglutamyl-peptidase I [Rubrivivax sp.]|nr:pyroglutamyl-peptidase I [Rubrivivax sp.]